MTFSGLTERVAGAEPFIVQGRVQKAVGLLIEGTGSVSPVGAKALIRSLDGERTTQAEVVGFQDKRIFLMPLEGILGVGPGSLVRIESGETRVPVGPAVLGRVLDGLGRPIDDKGPVEAETTVPLYRKPMNPLDRLPIRRPLDVGIRSLNGLLTCGEGQRVGIFAGSGVGKSTLLGMIARSTEADVNVIALIGERGREVQEFIQGTLGAEGMARSVVVAATSDQPPLLRKRGAFLAISVAEYFRDLGKRVLFIMDSITRFAMAQREIGLALGEPPATKGYPPSTFALLPVFLERAGKGGQEGGSITGIYTILVEGDDLSDPLADSARSLLDGHVVLSRELAAQGHYPAVDVLESVSRVMISVVPEDHLAAAQRLRALLAAYRRASDLISIGAYKEGSDPEVDRAVRLKPRIDAFLRQRIDEKVSLEEAWNSLRQLAAEAS